MFGKWESQIADLAMETQEHDDVVEGLNGSASVVNCPLEITTILVLSLYEH